MKLIYRALPLLALLSVLSTDIFAQGNPGGPGGCFPPPCVPVSDHIGWLIGAMIIFGVVKSIQFSRRSSKA
jgi:hypothetical protein